MCNNNDVITTVKHNNSNDNFVVVKITINFVELKIFQLGGL